MVNSCLEVEWIAKTPSTHLSFAPVLDASLCRSVLLRQQTESLIGNQELQEFRQREVQDLEVVAMDFLFVLVLSSSQTLTLVVVKVHHHSTLAVVTACD